MKSRSIVSLILSLFAIVPYTPVLAQKSESIDTSSTKVFYLAEKTPEAQQSPSWQEIVDKAPSYYKDKQAWINYFNTEIPRYLELGGDPNAEDRNDDTVLHYAAQSGDRELVEYLIDRGADPKAITDDGETVLQSAAFSGNRELVEHLIAKGADLNASSNNGWTLLHYAAESGDRELVVYLVAKGLDINAKDDRSRTPDSTFNYC